MIELTFSGLSLELKIKTLERIKRPPIRIENVISSSKNIKEKGYTKTHQLFLDMNFEDATNFCHKLESFGIFIDIAGRFGVAEITHRGMDVSDMEFIAHAISDIYFERVEDKLSREINEFTGQFMK